MSAKPKVFTELHAAMLNTQLAEDHPRIKEKERAEIVEFMLFMMNQSYWEGVERAAEVHSRKGMQ